MSKFLIILVVIIAIILIFRIVKNRNSKPLKEDIPIASEWLRAFFMEMNIDLDYSVESVKHLDKFLSENIEDGAARPNSKMTERFGYKIFAISSYIGEVIIKNSSNSYWITDDTDPAAELNITVKLDDGVVWPAQKVMKRIQNGSEDGLYGYVYMLLNKDKK